MKRFDNRELFKGDYLITDLYEDEEHYRDIEMNDSSLSLAFKSIFITDKRALFLDSLIRLFQSLPIEENGEAIKYAAYTHAMTIYFLRMLAKYGLIEIEECDKIREEPMLDSYYEVIGSKFEGRMMYMYDIVFIKKRSLTKEDIPLLTRVMNTLKIPNNYIQFLTQNGVLKSHINNLKIFMTALSPKTPIEVAKRISYFFKE